MLINYQQITFSHQVSSPPKELAPYLALLLPFDTVVWAWVLASVVLEIFLLLLIDIYWNDMSLAGISSYIYEGII